MSLIGHSAYFFTKECLVQCFTLLYPILVLATTRQDRVERHEELGRRTCSCTGVRRFNLG